MKYFIYTLVALGFIYLLLTSSSRLKAFNAQQCAVYGKQADCKTPLTPRQLCENYYHAICTDDGELPEGVVR